MFVAEIYQNKDNIMVHSLKPTTIRTEFETTIRNKLVCQEAFFYFYYLV